MRHVPRRRFWVEILLAGCTGVLAVVTLFWHEWIEIVVGVDPDGGNGSVEWLVVAILFAATAGLGVGARQELRRAQLGDA